MAKKDSVATASSILKLVGGSSNVIRYTNCMTRLRLRVKNVNLVKIKELKNVSSILGVNQAGDEIQIILGPGYVRKVTEEFGKISNVTFGGEVDANDSNSSDKVVDAKSSLDSKAKAVKNEMKEKNTSGIQVFLSKFSNIFGPLIFGYIGAGLLFGIGAILESAYTTPGGINQITGAIAPRIWTNNVALSWSKFFATVFNIWKDAALVFVGWRTAKAFGGNGVSGAIGAGMFMAFAAPFVTAPFIASGTYQIDHSWTNDALTPSSGITTINVNRYQFLGIKITDPLNNWLTIGFRPTMPGPSETGLNNDGIAGTYGLLGGASGNMLGAMLVAGLTVPVEKQIRKFMPEQIDIVGTSVLSFFVVVFANYFLIIPISGILFSWLAVAFSSLSANAFGAALLASLFLVAVVFGIHQGFVPIYAAVFVETGVNTLFPILAMGGAAQVGAALALYAGSAKHSLTRRQISGAIIPGFLGIGEPLIYGVTLPRIKPFITACLGALFGGFLIGAINQWSGFEVGLNSQYGPSGLLALPMMTANLQPSLNIAGNMSPALGMGIYVLGLLTSYGGGFVMTRYFGMKGVDLA